MKITLFEPQNKNSASTAYSTRLSNEGPSNGRSAELSPDAIRPTMHQSHIESMLKALKDKEHSFLSKKEIDPDVAVTHFDHSIAAWTAEHPELPCVPILDGNLAPHIQDFLSADNTRTLQFALIGFKTTDPKAKPTRHKQLIVMHKHEGKSAFVVFDAAITQNVENSHYFYKNPIADNPKSNFLYYPTFIQNSYVGCAEYMNMYMKVLSDPRKGKPFLDSLLADLREGRTPQEYATREKAFYEASFSEHPALDLSRQIFRKFQKSVQDIPNLHVRYGLLDLPPSLAKYTTFHTSPDDKKLSLREISHLRQFVGDDAFNTQSINKLGHTIATYMDHHRWDIEAIVNLKPPTRSGDYMAFVRGNATMNGAIWDRGIRRVRKTLEAMNVDMPKSAIRDPRVMTKAQIAEAYPDIVHYSQVPRPGDQS